MSRGRSLEPLVRQVRETIARWQLLRWGDSLVLGVSGGPDSLCLLHVLREIAPAYGAALHVGHLDHGIRSDSADDAAYVRAVCAEWGVPCSVQRADVPALAHAEHLAIEEAARVARYRFLGGLALAQGAQAVAVAHHADDQSETVLMHVLRGSGMAGLRGMRPLSHLEDMHLGPWAPPHPIRLLRPLLHVRRSDIDAYCTAHGLEPRFDRSNLDLTYYRNRLRHELLPLLETYNPNVREVLRRTAEVIAADYDLLLQMLDAAWQRVTTEEDGEHVLWRRAVYAAQPVALQRGLLREAVRRLRRSLRNVNWAHIEEARIVATESQVGARATLPGGLELSVGYATLAISSPGYRPLVPDGPHLVSPVTLPREGDLALQGGAWIMRVSLLDRQALPADWQRSPERYVAYLDADRLAAPLCLRTRRPGDWLVPLGLAHRQKVGDLMTNAKVPLAQRDAWPLLVCGEDLVWVVGLRLDGRFAVSPATCRIVSIRLIRATRGEEEQST